MKQHLTEQKFQNWRAIAVLTNNIERLIVLGHSSDAVRFSYCDVFSDVLSKQEQLEIKRIELQRWDGMADIGKWVQKDFLKNPTEHASKVSILQQAAVN